jgi:hypothetical protein
MGITNEKKVVSILSGRFSPAMERVWDQLCKTRGAKGKRADMLQDMRESGLRTPGAFSMCDPLASPDADRCFVYVDIMTWIVRPGMGNPFPAGTGPRAGAFTYRTVAERLLTVVHNYLAYDNVAAVFVLADSRRDKEFGTCPVDVVKAHTRAKRNSNTVVAPDSTEIFLDTPIPSDPMTWTSNPVLRSRILSLVRDAIAAGLPPLQRARRGEGGPVRQSVVLCGLSKELDPATWGRFATPADEGSAPDTNSPVAVYYDAGRGCNHRKFLTELGGFIHIASEADVRPFVYVYYWRLYEFLYTGGVPAFTHEPEDCSVPDDVSPVHLMDTLDRDVWPITLMQTAMHRAVAGGEPGVRMVAASVLSKTDLDDDAAILRDRITGGRTVDDRGAVLPPPAVPTVPSNGSPVVYMDAVAACRRLEFMLETPMRLRLLAELQDSEGNVEVADRHCAPEVLNPVQTFVALIIMGGTDFTPHLPQLRFQSIWKAFLRVLASSPPAAAGGRKEVIRLVTVRDGPDVDHDADPDAPPGPRTQVGFETLRAIVLMGYAEVYRAKKWVGEISPEMRWEDFYKLHGEHGAGDKGMQKTHAALPRDLREWWHFVGWNLYYWDMGALGAEVALVGNEGAPLPGWMTTATTVEAAADAVRVAVERTALKRDRERGHALLAVQQSGSFPGSGGDGGAGGAKRLRIAGESDDEWL